jgi:fatty acid desaturase
LIPGFVGVGAILAGLLGEGDVRRALRDGSRSIIASVVLFAIFGSLFGALGFLGDYWPVLLILLGLLIFAQVLFRPRR